MVVAPGTNIGDELQQLRSLKEKKENLQESFKAQENVDKPKDFLDIHGNVKDRMSKILAGGDKDDESEKDSDEEKQKDLEAIKAQVSDVKNKWKTGEVEKAETKDADAKNELEELRKGGIKVRERFNERLQPATDDSVNKSYNAHELDTSSAAEARKSFLDGAAFQTGPVEKTANDLQDIKFTGLNSFKDKFEKGEGDGEDHRERQILDLDVQLNSIKGALEKGGVDESDMTPEERAERKKKEIEAEFLRYKLARKIQAKKAAENAEAEPEEPAADEKPHLDVEVKMAGKAREKFKNIEAQNPNSVPLPKQETKHKPSKWDTKKEPVAEVVNKRVVEESSEEEEDESAFDVKNLMNKFKNIKTDDTKVEKANLEELEELRKQAKNLRKQFEQKNELEDAEQAEEKRKELAEEFKRLKEEREKMQQQLKEEEGQREKTPEEKEEVNVAADHASKMTAKWEKIHAKEAKKAGKSKMPTKST
uniref:LIM zinc-binding domain-containing protein n=1 Tax=Panagrellus redivivus TaxID=6233 RepID=A0A7E4V934_PANRE